MIIFAERILHESGRVHSGCIRTNNGRITEIAESNDPPRDADHVLTEGMVIPGLIDLQVNGCFGVDFLSDPVERWSDARRGLVDHGVTSFLPTFITAPVDVLAGQLAHARQQLASARDALTSRVLGVHLEGPFLSPARHGAHDRQFLVKPTMDSIDRLLDAGGSLLRMVTLAPELAGSIAAIARLDRAGVLVAIGHSDATAGEARLAVDAGARAVTHLFNAMRPLHHRDPGIAGVALTDRRLHVSLVLDLHNVDATAATIAHRCLGDRLLLVSDSIAGTGVRPGRHVIGGKEVNVAAGEAPVTDSGAIAGTSITLDAAVRNAIGTGIDVPTAIAAATSRPAAVIGEPDLGRIGLGARADMVWLTDHLRPRATWMDGRLVGGAT